MLFGVYEKGLLYCLGFAQKHVNEASLRCVYMALLSVYGGLDLNREGLLICVGRCVLIVEKRFSWFSSLHRSSL